MECPEGEELPVDSEGFIVDGGVIVVGESVEGKLAVMDAMSVVMDAMSVIMDTLPSDIIDTLPSDIIAVVIRISPLLNPIDERDIDIEVTSEVVTESDSRSVVLLSEVTNPTMNRKAKRLNNNMAISEPAAN